MSGLALQQTLIFWSTRWCRTCDRSVKNFPPLLNSLEERYPSKHRILRMSSSWEINYGITHTECSNTAIIADIASKCSEVPNRESLRKAENDCSKRKINTVKSLYSEYLHNKKFFLMRASSDPVRPPRHRINVEKTLVITNTFCRSLEVRCNGIYCISIDSTNSSSIINQQFRKKISGEHLMHCRLRVPASFTFS